LGLALTAMTAVMDLGTFYLGRARSPIYLILLMMRAVSFAAPSVASVWLALGLLGRWRRHRVWDWVEVCGIVIGIAWLVLFGATQLNF
jgi:hypothetical protein